MHSILRALSRRCALLGGLIMAVVAFLTVSSVISRALWSAPIQGDVELTQFGVALSISLCLPWAQFNGGNIIVDFFTTRASARTQQVFDGIGSLMLGAMVALLAWRTAAGAVSVYSANETSMILGLPMWIVYSVLAPGLALTTLIALHQSAQQLHGAQTP